ncbi:MAG TPA: NHLP family bacteriocin export ABC transporter peptidase/permease/ATPase subunit [Chloroflexia bacterium]|nr:NHLP family bacteriocin export ABC transporter peptidase/permease/ATPase subunit [Chloroflexia bacterium]
MALAIKSGKAFQRIKTPTILQLEAVECGAASLGIVLAYFGRFVPLEELRAECGVSRDGSKASNIVKAARKYGVSAKGYRKEPASLRSMPLPLIVHWQFNHFLVVEGFGKNKVYLNDPDSGPRSISNEEFDQGFTGVVLAFEKTPEFKKAGAAFKVIPSLRQRLQGSSSGLLFVVLASLSLVLPGLVVPVFGQVFVDYYLAQRLDAWLGPLLLGMAFTAVMRAGLTWLKEYYLLRLETRLAVSMSSRFFWHVLRLPLQYYYQRFTGEIGNRVAINDRVASLLSGRLASTLLDLTTLLFYALVMLVYNPLLAGLAISFAGINLLVLRYVSRKRVDLNQRLLQESSKLAGIAMNGLTTIETLKASGRESDFFTRLMGYQAKITGAEQEIGLFNQFMGIIPPLLTQVNTAAVLAIGGLQVINGNMTLGMLVAFQSLLLSFLTPINNLVNLGSTLQEVEGDLKRLDDVLGSKPDSLITQQEQQSSQEAQSLPKLTGQLELKNINFGYNLLEPPLIEDFNLLLRPGSRVALVGGSGSGKSTVAKLVTGLFQPWKGEILFDGQPLNAVSRTLLTNSVAVVDQDIFLFEGTVHENLTMWDPTYSEAQVVQAVKDACIHADIAARPGGYASLVAEGGQNFSGGQRQRLEIARALVSGPAILILDEATSALDPVTEKTITENLQRRGCTCLIIAHRLSTIRDCDEIIVMEHGRIVQRGTHDELLKDAEGVYAHLIAS